MSGPRQHTQPVQERSEPAVTSEAINTLTAHACGVFDVRLSAEWRDRPTHGSRHIRRTYWRHDRGQLEPRIELDDFFLDRRFHLSVSTLPKLIEFSIAAGSDKNSMRPTECAELSPNEFFRIVQDMPWKSFSLGGVTHVGGGLGKLKLRSVNADDLEPLVVIAFVPFL